MLSLGHESWHRVPQEIRAPGLMPDGIYEVVTELCPAIDLLPDTLPRPVHALAQDIGQRRWSRCLSGSFPPCLCP